MNREIKFRGIRVDNGEWVKGWYLEYPSMNHPTDCDPCITYGFGPHQRVIPETVGQYTGLKDKAGVEIYEGDILDAVEGEGSYYPNRTIIEYHALAFMFVGITKNASPFCEYTLDTITCKGHVSYRDGEVIGNIHQNPELMETDK